MNGAPLFKKIGSNMTPINTTLFGNKVFADVLRMRSQQNRKDPSANVTGILTERRNLDTDMHTGRMPCEDEARDGVMLPQAKEH